MAIKAIVDKIEDVEEPFRTLYTEKNGKFELTGVEGMKTQADIDRLTSALEKERKDHKASKGLWAPLGERKPEDVLALLDRIPELELAAAGKIDDKKINEMVETRIGSKTGPLTRQIQTLTTQLGDAGKVIEGFQAKEKQRTIHDSIREAVGKATGFIGAALEDALMFGERMLDVNEDGKVVTKDSVGVTPGVDAFVWLTEMQNKKPHWWGATQGGGAGGNNGKGGSSSGPNPWAHDTWNMTEQGKLFRQNPERAAALAKSAGTSIGGSKPVKK